MEWEGPDGGEEEAAVGPQQMKYRILGQGEFKDKPEEEAGNRREKTEEIKEFVEGGLIDLGRVGSGSTPTAAPAVGSTTTARQWRPSSGPPGQT